MAQLAPVLALLWASAAPTYEDVAPWSFRGLNKQLAGKSVRVREIVGRIGTDRWSPQLSLKRFRQKDWLMVTSRDGWSHAFYLVSVHRPSLLVAAHRLEPGDKCTMYGRVVGVARRVSGSACILVDRIERGWPEGPAQKAPAKSKIIELVEP